MDNKVNIGKDSTMGAKGKEHSLKKQKVVPTKMSSFCKQTIYNVLETLGDKNSIVKKA